MKINSDLLLALQEGINIESNPFATLGERLGLTTQEIISHLKFVLTDGIARRFGAVFDSAKLGYHSTLCAVDLPDDLVDEITAQLIPHLGITHCYERKGHPNIWFTLTTPANNLTSEIEKLQKLMPNRPIINLPASQRFKIATIFDLKTGKSSVTETLSLNTDSTATPDILQASNTDKAIVRALQKTIPLETHPFATVAKTLEMEEAPLLTKLLDWKARGIIRRIGLILKHRQAGFSANGMCVWNVDPQSITAHGIALAKCPEVTHCYHRPLHQQVPFNLYAMIHADTLDSAHSMLEQISERANLPIGKMLVSTREFKKSSPAFFLEPSA